MRLKHWAVQRGNKKSYQDVIFTLRADPSVSLLMYKVGVISRPEGPFRSFVGPDFNRGTNFPDTGHLERNAKFLEERWPGRQAELEELLQHFREAYVHAQDEHRRTQEIEALKRVFKQNDFTEEEVVLWWREAEVEKVQNS